MQELFTAFLNAGISGSVMIAAVLVLRIILKRAPRTFTCLLWLLVMVRLLCPFSIPANFSLQPDLHFRPETDESSLSGEESLPEDVATPPIALDPGNFPTPQVAPDGFQMPSQTPSVTVPNVTAPQPSLTAIAGIVWLLGFGSMVLYAAISYLRLCWRVRSAIPAEGFCQVYDLDTAFVLGFVKPKIYLPMELNGECRCHVLAHERAHIARGDHWLKLLSFLALTVHWYNPLVWLSFVLLARDIEAACDQRVIAGKDAAFRQSYSAALLKCSTRSTVHACPIAFAEISVKDRIKAVLNYRKSALWLIILAVVVIACVAVFLMTDPAPKPDPTIPDDTSAQDPGSFPTPQSDPDAPTDPAGWGLSFWADNVTPTGCTLHFWQQGGLTWQDNSGAVIEGELTMGAMFHIQSFDGSEWEDLKPIAEVQWDAILYMLPLDGSLTLDIRWDYIYGQLPPGTYRVVKEITGPGETRPDVACEYYAEFTVTDADVDDAALLETCRRALEEYQSRGNWHLQQSNCYGEMNTPSTVDTWWISGDNFLISTASAQFGASCTMYRDGVFYQKRGGSDMDESLEPDVWQQTDTLYGIMEPWILLLKWQDENITLVSHQAAMGQQEISLRWKGPLILLAGENEYMEVTFGLDVDGTLKSLVIRADLLTDGGDTVPYTSTMVDLSQGYSTEFVQNYIDSQLIDAPIAGDPGDFPTPELEPNN